ncbi:alpha carbonic anhydrase 4 [Lactuca sativa]|uniref:alpha carbonic anhydrase 4 n=1 Tax=Lactuca sativa TaxID=4236 RepID=UPI0022AE96A5|nr:alpha carbonic anhydrase 4 [Lactuca sativa]
MLPSSLYIVIVSSFLIFQIEWQGDAGGISINGVNYNLVHSHWHFPSEHTIDGKRFDAELHLVHSSEKEELAVMASLYTIGQPDPLIQSLADKMKGLTDTKGIDVGTISASNIKCGGTKYFRYIGSLTTPPCTEGVTWTIAEKAKTISQDQIQMIKEDLEREFQENSRPIQLSGERSILQFDLPSEQ